VGSQDGVLAANEEDSSVNVLDKSIFFDVTVGRRHQYLRSLIVDILLVDGRWSSSFVRCLSVLILAINGIVTSRPPLT
jgi:hypothetical protein